MSVPIPPDPALVPYPTVDVIGSMLRARTQSQVTDQEVGTFTADTRPTDEQVLVLIAQAANVVYSSTGNLDRLVCESADQVRGSANFLIGLLAACLVELSYYPEQVKSDRSAFQGYYDLFTGELTGMPMLMESVSECIGGEVSPDDSGSGAGFPSFAFPEDLGGLVGWQTQW